MEHQHVVCTACGSVNRLPGDKPALAARCGQCRERLFQGKPADVDGAVFERQIQSSTIPVLVDIWAPWCGPCRMMAPAFEAAAAELEPRMRLIKLNSDEEQQVSARLGIRGIPTMIMFRGGRELGRQSGAMSAGQIVQWARTTMASAG